MQQFKRVNIIIGRFQPFTSAHKKIVEEMYTQNQLPAVIFYINQNKPGIRHPFTSDTVKEVINATFNGDAKLYAGAFAVESADIVKIGEVLYNNKMSAVLLGCGTDRYSAYKKQVDNPKYREKGHFLSEFDVYELKRDMEDSVSATKVRNAIKSGDYSSFQSMTSIKDKKLSLFIYNKLKREIDSVYESMGQNCEQFIVPLSEFVIKFNGDTR